MCSIKSNTLKHVKNSTPFSLYTYLNHSSNYKHTDGCLASIHSVTVIEVIVITQDEYDIFVIAQDQRSSYSYITTYTRPEVECK